MRSYGFIGNPAALRSIFKDLTGDGSAPINLSTSEMDSRFELAMLCEDDNIINDLDICQKTLESLCKREDMERVYILQKL